MSGFKALHKSLLNRGVYMGPSGYEVGFISQAHTPEIIATAVERFIAALDEIMA